jgi:hypothetical protein
MNHYLIIGFLILLIFYKIKSKNKDLSYKTNKDTIYVILRIKDDNLENTEKFLRSFQKQTLENKKLIIMNDIAKFEKYFIVYCDLNNNTDLYSAEKFDESKFNLVLRDLGLSHNQIVLTVENEEYFNDENLLKLISNKKIKSYENSDLKNNQPKYYLYQKN